MFKKYIFRTGFKHIPCILGKEIDLYLLYWLVTSQGGWEKVRLQSPCLVAVVVTPVTLEKRYSS